jgi:hypothetical protein
MPRSPSMLPKQPTQQQVMSSKLKRDFQYQGSEDPARQQETFDNTGLNASSSDNQMFLGTFKNVRNSITAEKDKDFNGSPRKGQNGKVSTDSGTWNVRGYDDQKDGQGDGHKNGTAGTSNGDDRGVGTGREAGAGAGTGTWKETGTDVRATREGGVVQAGNTKSDNKWTSDSRGIEPETPEGASYFPGKSCSNGSSNTINIGLNIDIDQEMDVDSSRGASLNDDVKTTHTVIVEERTVSTTEVKEKNKDTGKSIPTATAKATVTAIGGAGKDTEDNIDNDDDTNYGIQLEPEHQPQVEVEVGGVPVCGDLKESSEDVTPASSCPTPAPFNSLTDTDAASSSSGSVSDTPMPRSSFRLLSTNPSFPSRPAAAIRLPGAASSPSFPSSSSRFLISPDKKAKARPTCYFSSPTLFQRVLINALAHPFLVVSVKMITNPELDSQNWMYSYVYIVSRSGFQGLYSGIR